MAEEQKTETTQTEETKPGKVVFNSQEDFDAVISRRLQKEREKFSDYNDTKSELETLRQEKKEREEAELSESQKLQKQLEDKEKEINDLSVFKLKHEEWELREKEKIEKAMADLPDEDKELVNDLPLEKRMIMVNKLSGGSTVKPTPPTEKAFKIDNTVPTPQEAMDIRTKFGSNSYEYRTAAELIRKTKGN